MLAGVGAAEGISWLLSNRGFPKIWTLEMALQLSAVVIFAFFVITKSVDLGTELKSLPSFATPGLRPTATETQFLIQINENAAESEVMVTDLPLYAFRAGLTVPPELAVFSYKRVITGNLPEELIVQIVEDTKPRLILLGRFEYTGLEKILLEDYMLVHWRESMRLFLRNPTE
jgi:hypothetical protein